MDETQRISRLEDDASLAAMADLLTSMVDQIAQAEHPYPNELEAAMQDINQELKAAMRSYRIEILEHTAAGELTSQKAFHRTDSARWIRRQGYHLWRIVDHLSDSPQDRQDGLT